MNQHNLARLIEHLKTLNPAEFRMTTFMRMQDGLAPDCLEDITGDVCGTVGCIAGHIVFAFRDELPLTGYIEDVAKNWLEIDAAEALDLFYAITWAPDNDIRNVTLPIAIEHLETLVHKPA